MRLRTATSLMSLLGALALGFLAYEVVTPADRLEAGSLVVELPAHDGVLGIANRLQRADAIRSRAGFVLLTMARGSSRSLKAGEYELERGATTLDVLTLIESGRVKQHAILHPEGATVTELARVLEADRLTTARDVARLSTVVPTRRAWCAKWTSCCAAINSSRRAVAISGATWSAMSKDGVPSSRQYVKTPRRSKRAS